MYFIEGKTQREVADDLGFKSTQPIRRIFREMGFSLSEMSSLCPLGDGYIQHDMD